jgi:hypothetical protein
MRQGQWNTALMPHRADIKFNFDYTVAQASAFIPVLASLLPKRLFVFHGARRRAAVVRSTTAPEGAPAAVTSLPGRGYWQSARADKLARPVIPRLKPSHNCALTRISLFGNACLGTPAGETIGYQTS